MTLDEYSIRNFPPKEISFAEIYQFKGLENEAVIVVDLPPPDHSRDNFALHYIGMSRARAILSMVYRAEPA
jgi:hypothetical protein